MRACEVRACEGLTCEGLTCGVLAREGLTRVSAIGPTARHGERAAR